MFLGGMIYILWRSDTLTMFSWFNYLGISEVIGKIRIASESFSTVLPNWLVYSAPNALWFFSGIVVFDLIWNQETKMKILWLSLFCLLAVGSEIAQAVGIVEGTFDYQDIILMIIAGLLAFFVIDVFKHEQEKQHES